MRATFAKLFQSSHLGVVIATQDRVVDANDAFLKMIEFTRDEMHRGLINWQELTPPEFSQRDKEGVEQVRNFGVAVPYEKAFRLRSGRRVDFVTGAVLLSREPLKLVSYTVDVSETNRLRQAKQQLQARQKIINQLAHELNNPLAALTFLLHALVANAGPGHTNRALLEQAMQQLDRISDTVREVVAQTEGIQRISPAGRTDAEACHADRV